MGKKILMTLGGTWHDFDGFAAAMTPVLQKAGYEVDATYDLDALAQVAEGGYDLVLLNTCIGEVRQDDGPTAPGLTDAQAESLASWVQGGGGLLAVHAATVAGQTSPALRALVGGVFVEHPPQFSFTVYPLYKEHPITAGIGAFTVHDEFYVQAYDDTVAIHAIALDRGVAHPMVWSKSEGKGRVVYIAMGHGPEVWELEPYQRLVLQAIEWLTA
ncbi:MAG: ThuA domain-containing protein [Anaerolineae bacterium]|nr:ThuA domain-containing protein [Anaerolineae bacterium]